MEKYIVVPIKRYLELENSENELLYLSDCGVDNWNPGISVKEWEESTGNSMEFTEEDINFEIIEK